MNFIIKSTLAHLFTLGLMFLLPQLSQAQDITTTAVDAPTKSQSILLRNVHLIKRDDPSAKILVNVLLKDKHLDLLTEDNIPLENADITYDAKGGVILGQLELGALANFLILDKDPREEIEVLLDTKSYTRFAIHKGEIIKNLYATVLHDDPAPEKKAPAEDGWLAYAPPPIAVPLDYWDTTRWNRFESKYVTGLAGAALVLDRQAWIEQDNDSIAQVGDLNSFDGGQIRALRFGAVGSINFAQPWIWTIFASTHAFDKGFDSASNDSLSFLDVRLDIPLSKKLRLSVGKQKEPISMERTMSLLDNPMQERSAVSDGLLPARNVGMVLSSTVFDNRATVAGGAFNNWLDENQPHSFSDNGMQYIGRATWLPYLSANESTLLHLGVGLRYSDGKEGGIGQSKPEFSQAPRFVNTQRLDTDQMMTYQIEASLRSGPAWVHGEYVRTEVDSPLNGDPSFHGYHLTASWILTGEMRPYRKGFGAFGKMPIARSVNQNGWGAWELSTRYSRTDFNDGNVEGGDMSVWSAGVNWWLNPYMNVNFNYRLVELHQYNDLGLSQGVNLRVSLILE